MQRKKIQVGGSLKPRVGRQCCISRGGPGSTVEVYKLEESREEGIVLIDVGSPEKAGGSSRSESCQEF